MQIKFESTVRLIGPKRSKSYRIYVPISLVKYMPTVREMLSRKRVGVMLYGETFVGNVREFKHTTGGKLGVTYYITIPKKIAVDLGLQPGDKVEVIIFPIEEIVGEG